MTATKRKPFDNIYCILNFFSRITGTNSTQLITKNPWVKGIQVIFFMKDHILFQGEILITGLAEIP